MEAEGIPGPQSSIRKACGACVGLQMSWNGWNTENVAAKVILPQWYAHLLFARYCTKICTRRTYCLVALWRCGSITLHKAFLCTLSRNLILRRLELGLPLLLVRLPPSPHHTHTHTHTPLLPTSDFQPNAKHSYSSANTTKMNLDRLSHLTNNKFTLANRSQSWK